MPLNWLPSFNRHQVRFCLVFLACLGLLEGLFRQWQSLFAQIYMYPISAVAASALNALGMRAQLDTSAIASGFCTLRMDKVVFQIIYECTGMFALFILAAAIIAYPASLAQKIWGLLGGSFAFFLYSTLRLFLLGTVGYLAPGWILLFHLYLMVLLNLGFMVFLWLWWVSRVRPGR